MVSYNINIFMGPHGSSINGILIYIYIYLCIYIYNCMNIHKSQLFWSGARVPWPALFGPIFHPMATGPLRTPRFQMWSLREIPDGSWWSRPTLALDMEKDTICWLVVSTPLQKYESQLGWWNSQYMEKKVPNHQPDLVMENSLYMEVYSWEHHL